MFLFPISVMPFTSDLIGKYSENPLTFSRHYDLLNERGEAVLAGYRSVQGVVDIFFCVIAILVALYSPDLGKLCWLGLAVSPHIGSLVAKCRAASAA